jgi:hypothetical protein
MFASPLILVKSGAFTIHINYFSRVRKTHFHFVIIAARDYG